MIPRSLFLIIFICWLSKSQNSTLLHFLKFLHIRNADKFSFRSLIYKLKSSRVYNSWLVCKVSFMPGGNLEVCLCILFNQEEFSCQICILFLCSSSYLFILYKSQKLYTFPRIEIKLVSTCCNGWKHHGDTTDSTVGYS